MPQRVWSLYRTPATSICDKTGLLRVTILIGVDGSDRTTSTRLPASLLASFPAPVPAGTMHRPARPADASNP